MASRIEVNYRACSYMEFVPEQLIANEAMELIPGDYTDEQYNLALLVAKRKNEIAHGIEESRESLARLELKLMNHGDKFPEDAKYVKDLCTVLRVTAFVHDLIMNDMDPSYIQKN